MPHQKPDKYIDSYILRCLLIGIGWFSIALGVIGIFVPVLPTVPFLLLAAACFARSSERFHSWLIDHKQLGPLISGYLSGTGMPLRAKISALVMIWLSILISAFLLVHLLWVRFLLLGIAACLTFYLLRLPTAPPAE